MQMSEKIMKRNETNSKNTVSESERDLKHLKLVGIGREYVEKRLAEMQKKKKTSETVLQTNGRKNEK